MRLRNRPRGEDGASSLLSSFAGGCFLWTRTGWHLDLRAPCPPRNPGRLSQSLRCTPKRQVRAYDCGWRARLQKPISGSPETRMLSAPPRLLLLLRLGSEVLSGHRQAKASGDGPDGRVAQKTLMTHEHVNLPFGARARRLGFSEEKVSFIFPFSPQSEGPVA